jgi:hypothetical protein
MTGGGLPRAEGVVEPLLNIHQDDSRGGISKWCCSPSTFEVAERRKDDKMSSFLRGSLTDQIAPRRVDGEVSCRTLRRVSRNIRTWRCTVPKPRLFSCFQAHFGLRPACYFDLDIGRVLTLTLPWRCLRYVFTFPCRPPRPHLHPRRLPRRTEAVQRAPPYHAARPRGRLALPAFPARRVCPETENW